MMHGRKKVPKRELSQEEKEQRSQKLEKIKQLNSKLIALRQKHDLDESRLIITEKAAFLSPDWTTLWNYRRQILANVFDAEQQKLEEVKDVEEASTDQQSMKDKQQTKHTPHALKCYSLMLKQLGILNKLLKISPKSYTLWFQRQWILLRAFRVEPILDSNQDTKKQNKNVLRQQQGLCQMMLSRDQRNFHCWNYKSWLLDQEIECLKLKYPNEGEEQQKEINIVLDRQIAYGTQLINKNFSNFSAWFFRSKVFKQRFHQGLSEELIRSELKLLKSAYFTEPKDQSPWQYHKWILGQVIPVQVSEPTLHFEQFVVQVVSVMKVDGQQQQQRIEIQLSDYIELKSLKDIVESDAFNTILEANQNNNQKYINKITLPNKTFLKTSKVQTLTGLRNFRGYQIEKETIQQNQDKFLQQIINQEMKSISQLIDLDKSLEYANKRYVELCHDLLQYEQNESARKQALDKLEDLANVINPRFKQFYTSFKDKFIHK